MTKKPKRPTKTANFRVDTRIAVLLGESYTSTERALKELVDNAWDADASTVWITLPAPMTSDPIIIRDDGAGMTAQELEREYLFIANDRRTRKGATTPGKSRPVKGRKGVGKFAGLCAAQLMTVTTRARGLQTTVGIDRKILEKAGSDIERVPLPIGTENCAPDDHGTTITLTELEQNLHFPTPEKFRPLLMREYGREEGISIFVNDTPLGLEDFGGSVIENTVEIEGAGSATLRFTVSEDRSRVRGAGIAVRVKGRVVGKPLFLGLDESEDFPRSLLGQIYGELVVDGLENDVTADFAAILENSKAFDRVREWAAPIIKQKVSEVHGREMQLAQARLQQKIKRRLAELPEHRRAFAEEALNKLLKKFYGESDEKLEPIVNVVFDAMERDDYRLIVERIDQAKDADVTVLADALQRFGLVDLAMVGQQATQRLKFLDYLEQLSEDPRTDEIVMHRAIEQNLWLLGPEYGVFASNRTLKTIVDKYLDKTYAGKNARDRPDLLLSANISQVHLLIEFKAPALTLTFANYQQATRYRHELASHISSPIEVMILGGKKDASTIPSSGEPNVKATTYLALIANARRQFEWLVKELASTTT